MRVLGVKLMLVLRYARTVAGRHCLVTGFLSTLLLMYALISVEQTARESPPEYDDQTMDRLDFGLRDLIGQTVHQSSLHTCYTL